MSKFSGRASKQAIEKHFGGMTYPELARALRHLDDLAMRRVADDPSKVAAECQADTRARERRIRLRRGA